MTIKDGLLDIKFKCDYEYVTHYLDNAKQPYLKLTKSTTISLREIYFYLKRKEAGHFRDFNKHLIPFYLLKHMFDVIKWSVILKNAKAKLLPNVKVPIQIVGFLLNNDNDDDAMKKLSQEYKSLQYLENNDTDIFFFNYFASCVSIFNGFRNEKDKDTLNKVFTKGFKFYYDFGNEFLNKFILKERISICPFDIVVMLKGGGGDNKPRLLCLSEFLNKYKYKSILYGRALKYNLIKK